MREAGLAEGQNGYALARCALKTVAVGVIAVCSAEPWALLPDMLLMFALADIAIAVWRHEALKADVLTYWDEAAFFALLYCAAM